MKKLVFLCILSVMCCFLWACSSSETTSDASTGIPDDLVVVLPDGQELYLYMPHDDAAEILGPADSTGNIGGTYYMYDKLSLTVAYKDNLLASLHLDTNSPCSLKNGLSPSSGKSDFINAGFSDKILPKKYYIIKDGKYKPTAEEPPFDTPFKSAIFIGSTLLYSNADKPGFKGYDIDIIDHYSSVNLGFDD